MTDNRKLPVTFQLVLVTSAVMFIVAAIRIFFMARAVWLNWQLIQVSPGVTDWSPLYIPAAFNLALAVACALVFVSVLYESRRHADFSLVFLAALIIMLAWGVYAWFMRYRGVWDYQDMSRTIWVFSVVRLLLFAWLTALLVAVFPKTSFSRLGSRRHA